MTMLHHVIMASSGLARPRVGPYCRPNVTQGGLKPLWECQVLNMVFLQTGSTSTNTGPAKHVCTHRCTELLRRRWLLLLLPGTPAQAGLGPCRLGSAGPPAVPAECTLCRIDALQGRRGFCCGKMAGE